MEGFAKQLRDMADTAEEMDRTAQEAQKSQEEDSAPGPVRTWCVLVRGYETPVTVLANTYTGGTSTDRDTVVFWRNGTEVAHVQGDVAAIWWVEEPAAAACCCCEGACSES